MRWLKRILILIIFVGLAAASVLAYLVRSSFPNVDGEISVPGISGRVEVVRDDWGIPHIFATTLPDLFFAQGYTHAQERFWQMDFWRHLGAGRLSELFGPELVETDVFLRSLSFTALAERELAAMSTESRNFLEWYANGVNAYLAERSGARLSLEYAVLSLQNRGYRPEPWTPIHTLTWAKLMSWDLSGNMLAEIDRTILARTLPSDRVERLYPGYPDEHPVIVEGSRATTGVDSPQVPLGAVGPLLQAGRAAERLWAITGGGFEGIGSNNWVLGGEMTASGMPILANDTHLSIQMPAIWYANGLHCLGGADDCPYRMVGFTFPGAPGIVVGHNGHVAWGVTTQAVDTQDLFIERVNPDNPRQYQVDGEWVDFERREEVIKVAGGDDHIFEVVSSRHGPVISGIFLDDDDFTGSPAIEEPDRYVVALAWQSLQPSTLIEAIQGMTAATNHEEFRDAVSLWDIAAQNVVYADVEGNIGYHSTGEVPIRANGDGRYPVPGWTTEYDWIGLVPFEEMPHLFNPPEGFIATANQPVLRTGDLPYLGSDGDPGHRAARIVEVLEGAGNHDVASMQRLQFDSFDRGAMSLVPYLLAVPPDGHPGVEAIQSALRPWTTGPDAYQARGDSAGTAAYQATWRHILANTFHDDLPEDSWPYGGSRWILVVASLVEDADNVWWDDVATPELETRDDILFKSMVEAHEELVDTLGSNPRDWSWGKLHVATFRHQTFGSSGIAPVEWLFNRRAPTRVGGSNSLVNAVGWDAAAGYQVDWLPSFRMVIDLGALSDSTYLHTTGQSGHAFHRHYDDMIPEWAEGAQAPMLWDRDEILLNARSTLTLTPGD